MVDGDGNIVYANQAYFKMTGHTKDDLKSGDLQIDTTLAIPNEFDNMLDHMTHSWIIQRAKGSNCTSSDDVPVSDSICKLRLSKMPCLIPCFSAAPSNNSNECVGTK